MKSLTTFLILFSFMGIAVFGFATMGHNSNHSRTGCIAAATQNIDCVNDNLASFLAIHFNAFSKLSSAIFIKNSAVAFILIIALLLSMAYTKISAPTLKRAYANQLGSTPPNARLKLKDWLSRHENSPTNF